MQCNDVPEEQISIDIRAFGGIYTTELHPEGLFDCDGAVGYVWVDGYIGDGYYGSDGVDSA